MNKISYVCKQCKERFKSEEEVKRHLQWVHNIPPLVKEGMKKPIEDLFDSDIEDLK